MHIPYAQQLAGKKKALRGVFGFEGKIEASPLEFRYRGKIELAYINGLLGYRRRDDFLESFELKKCFLVSVGMNRIIQKVAELLREFNADCASIMKRKSGLGYVTFRENMEGDSMVNFTYFGNVDENAGKIAAKLFDGGVKSVNILLNETWGDSAYGKVVQRKGEEFIVGEILRKKFLIGPNTFFQANLSGAEMMFSEVKGFIENGSKVLDLYCGVGVISISIADKCSEVVGIESNRESVMNALQNAQLNGCINTRFVAGDVAKILNEIDRADIVVADPPRAGIHPKAIKRLLEISPKRIIYVSCNPETLAADISQMHGYGTVFMKAFDMFPHTKHCEVICVLEKK